MGIEKGQELWYDTVQFGVSNMQPKSIKVLVSDLPRREKLGNERRVDFEELANTRISGLGELDRDRDWGSQSGVKTFEIVRVSTLFCLGWRC